MAAAIQAAELVIIVVSVVVDGGDGVGADVTASVAVACILVRCGADRSSKSPVHQLDGSSTSAADQDVSLLSSSPTHCPQPHHQSALHHHHHQQQQQPVKLSSNVRCIPTARALITSYCRR